MNVIRFREIVGFDQQSTFGDVTSNEELNTLLSILFFAKVDFLPHVIMDVFLLKFNTEASGGGMNHNKIDKFLAKSNRFKIVVALQEQRR